MGPNLQHSGILGMKWGVRRTDAQLGHPSGSGDAPGGKSSSPGGSKKGGGGTAKVSGKVTGGKTVVGPQHMTDDHLKKVVSRLQMEENYSNLVARQKDRATSPAKKFLSEALNTLGKQAMNAAVNKLVSKAFESRKKFNSSEFDFKDPSKQSPEKLKAAVAWYSAKNAYTKLRSEGKP